ncbi:MAG: HslU--HslV peptidase ATPase subunit, partial [Acidobacteria bacterium]
MKNRQELLPREIVAQLDKYIIGQDQAKKAVAIALRNRVRRQKLPKELAEDITPKNIIMIGPTGVGKTEIARRLARLAGAPFVKVEASKFTEVGYVGRDVESMVRDLVRNSLQMVKEQQTKSVMKKARAKAVDRVVDHLFPLPKLSPDDENNDHLARITARRENARKEILAGGMDDRKILIEIAPQPKMPFLMDVMTDPSNMEDFAASL